MNSRRLLIYSLAAVTLAGCVPRERFVSDVKRQWPAAEIHRIEVREVDGAINVHGGTTDQILLGAHIRSYGKRPDRGAENLGYFETSVEGDTLVIGRRHGRHEIHIGFFWDRNESHISYDLTVPQNIDLQLSTVNGLIETRGIEGETRATTVNGILDLECAGTKELTAKSVNGRIQATFLKDFQGATLKTVNGRVTAVLPPSASFFGDFSQVNGDFEAAFPLNIHSHPGSRRVSGEVNGGKYELKITTVNGDIKVKNLGPPVPPPLPAPGTQSIPQPPPPPPTVPVPKT